MLGLLWHTMAMTDACWSPVLANEIAGVRHVASCTSSLHGHVALHPTLGDQCCVDRSWAGPDEILASRHMGSQTLGSNIVGPNGDHEAGGSS
jgi:hypothetical protein